MDSTRGAMSSPFSAAEIPLPTPLQQYWPRALSTPVSATQTNLSSSTLKSSTAIASSSTTTTTDRPFFQDPTSVTPPPSSSSSSQQSLPKAALEYILIAAFVIILGGILVQRLVYRSRNNASFWPSRENPSPPHPDVPALPQRFPRTTCLTGVPPYPYSRRTRAFDTDAAGRRTLDGIDSSDHDGYIGDKDVLPAYDNSGGPPKYREVALELDIMPTTRYVSSASQNSTNTRNAAADDASRESRDSHPLSDVGQRRADALGAHGSLTVPAAVHVRQ